MKHRYRYNSVIFDMDGTLVNTLPDIVAVVNSVIDQIGMSEKTEEQIRAGVGCGVEHLLSSIGVPSQWNSPLADEVAGRYAREKNSRAYVYQHVPEMLEELIRAGVKIGILSNKPEKGLEKTISDKFAGIAFSSVKGSSMGKPAKQTPELLSAMIEEMQVDRESVLLVGDGEPDIAVSKAAGVDCLSVLWGFRTREQLSDAGAVMFAETPRDVVNLIIQTEQ